MQSVRVSGKTLSILAALADNLSAPAQRIEHLDTWMPDGTQAAKLSQIASLKQTDIYGAALYVLEAKNIPAELKLEAMQAVYQKQMDGGPDFSGGVMVALYPEPNDAKQIAIPDGVDPATLHMTLCYYGSAEDVKGTKPQWLAALAPVAAKMQPFTAQLNGITRFSADEEAGKDPIVVNVDAPEIEKLRNLVVKAKTPTKNASQHGYTPHMTVAYVDADDDHPLQRWQKRTVKFTGLTLSFGSHNVTIPFGDMAESKDVYSGVNYETGSPSGAVPPVITGLIQRPRRKILHRRVRHIVGRKKK